MLSVEFCVHSVGTLFTNEAYGVAWLWRAVKKEEQKQ